MIGLQYLYVQMCCCHRKLDGLEAAGSTPQLDLPRWQQSQRLSPFPVRLAHPILS